MIKRAFLLLTASAGLATGSTHSTLALSQTLTREQVRQELNEYYAAGFNPARQNPHTRVDDAQTASAKVRGTREMAQRSPQLAAKDAAVKSE